MLERVRERRREWRYGDLRAWQNLFPDGRSLAVFARTHPRPRDRVVSRIARLNTLCEKRPCTQNDNILPVRDNARDDEIFFFSKNIILLRPLRHHYVLLIYLFIKKKFFLSIQFERFECRPPESLRKITWMYPVHSW